MWWFRKRAADDEVADLLDRCLARIERGEATVESCLAAHPRHAEALRPLLITAVNVRTLRVPGPSAAAQARMRARMLAAGARPAPAVRRPVWQPALTAGLALALLALLAAPLTALQSGDSVPGDWDYGLKRAGERVRLAVTVNDTERRSVHIALAQRREREIQALLLQNRPEHLADAVRGLSVELASLGDSITRERTISESEARRIAEFTARQEMILRQVVEKPEVSQPVASAAQEARVTARAASEAAQARVVTPPPAPSPSPSPVPSPRPSPTPEASASPSPSPSPSATESPAPSPSPTPTPAPTPIPTATAAPAASPTPTAAGTATPIPPLRTPAPITAPPPAVAGTPLPPLVAPSPSPRTPPPSLGPGQILPSPSAAAATPAPTPVPTPTPSGRVSTTVPAPGVTLVPGIAQVFTYTGPSVRLLDLLAPAEGKYTFVSFRAPGGLLVLHLPGQSGGDQLVVPSGSEVTIIVTDTVTLRW